MRGDAAPLWPGEGDPLANQVGPRKPESHPNPPPRTSAHQPILAVREGGESLVLTLMVRPCLWLNPTPSHVAMETGRNTYARLLLCVWGNV